MRRFVVETLVDGVIILVIILFLGLFRVSQPFPFGLDSAPIFQLKGAGIIPFLVAAAILVLSQRFVRPVIVAFTGRLLLSTMGLFLVIVNALVIWAATLIAPDIATVAQPSTLWVLVFAALYTFLGAVADAVLGLNRPRIAQPAGTVRLWHFLESLPTPRRNFIIENLRLQQVYDLVYTVGLDFTLRKTPIGRFRQWFAVKVLHETDIVADVGGSERIRGLLEQLGPTYVKIGQMMASRSDILPPEMIEELSKLQSDAAPFSWEEASQVILGDLGKPPEELFASIEHEPFAAASTAQVHRATLHDGTVVAVKIQRPQIVAKTKADLGVMTQLAEIAERRVDLARKVGVAAMVREFAGGVLKELDYRNEAYQAKRLTDNMTRFPQIGVPRIYDELSSTRVLTEQFVKGIKVSKTEVLQEAGFDTDELGSMFIRATIKQILIDGFFHGDPHPGNLLADPDDKRLYFIDLGLVGQLSSTQRVNLLGLIYALKDVDIPGIADGFIALGTPSKQFDEVQFRSDVDRLSRQYLIYGGVTSLGGAISGFMGAVYSNGLRLDSSLTLAIKATVQAEETAAALSPTVNLADAAVTEAQAALLESLEPDRVAKQLQRTAVRVTKELAQRAPSMESAALKWLDLFNKGKIVVEVDTSQLSDAVTKVGGLGKQATIGLIVVGQLIGTALAMVILLQPALTQFVSFAYVAMIAFVVTLVVSFVVLFRMLFSREGDDQG